MATVVGGRRYLELGGLIGDVSTPKGRVLRRIPPSYPAVGVLMLLVVVS